MSVFFIFFKCHELFLAASAAEEVIPCYAQQLRERVRPDMITLGSLSLQQVSATKRNICVIIPYSPAHQPCPLCCVSEVWLMDTECVRVSAFVCLFVYCMSNLLYWIHVSHSTLVSVLSAFSFYNLNFFFLHLFSQILQNLSCEISFLKQTFKVFERLYCSFILSSKLVHGFQLYPL